MAIWVQRYEKSSEKPNLFELFRDRVPSVEPKYEKTSEMQKENLFFFSFPSASTFGMAKGEKSSEKQNLFELFRDGVPSAEPKYEKTSAGLNKHLLFMSR